MVIFEGKKYLTSCIRFISKEILFEDTKKEKQYILIIFLNIDTLESMHDSKE